MTSNLTREPATMETEQTEQTANANAIAVVGMAGRFPGSTNLREYWNTLVEGKNCISFFTPEEMIAFGVPPEHALQPNYVCASGAYSRPFDFDAGFFGYNPREAELLDPQHRVFLEHCWTALEHAGYDSLRYRGRIGVYGGGGTSNYLFDILTDTKLLHTLDPYAYMTANEKDFLTTRVGYKMDLRGPCVNVQTACSTSLVAITLGTQSLLNYQSDMVIAGGVRVDPYDHRGYEYTQGGINSPDGFCRTFDEDAKGAVWGNGVGAVVLKRLADAIADNDTIHAIILGTGLSNDGAAKVGYTAPGVEGQCLATLDAIDMAGVNPESISYVECHGTATPIGDPIEIAALTRSFNTYTGKRNYCAVASVKTNIGHNDAAAGVAGFLKVVMALKHRQIPASLHFRRANPQIDFESSPFYVNTVLRDWKHDGSPLRASVNSFGMGGTNTNVILEEAPIPRPTGSSRSAQLLQMSAKSEAALDTMAVNLARHLRENPREPLADVAHTLQVGRRRFAHRRALLVRDREEAIAALETDKVPAAITARREQIETPVCFLFPGQGSQHANMARELYDSEALFRSIVDQCCDLLKPQMGIDLRTILFPADDAVDEANRLLAQTANTQPALFIVEYALARTWMDWGIEPTGMVGHSVGEYVAATLAGVFTLLDALTLVAARGRLIQALPGGCMTSVLQSAEDIAPLLAAHPGVCIAALNAPGTCVLSGAPEHIERLEAALDSSRIVFKRLSTSHAFHSAMLDPVCAPFMEILRTISMREPTLPYVSNVTGTWITAAQATSPAYWIRHLREAVLFSDAIAVLAEGAPTIFLEVGPGNTLTSLASQHSARTRDIAVLSSLRHASDRSANASMQHLTTLGRLWIEGATIDWDHFYADEERRRIPLPTYPFEYQAYRLHFNAASSEPATLDPLKVPKRPDIADWFSAPSWKRTAPLPVPLSDDSERWLIFVDDCGFGERMAAYLEGGGHAVHRVRKGLAFACSDTFDFTVRAGERDDQVAMLQTLRAQDRLPKHVAYLWAVTSLDKGAIELGTVEDSLELTFYTLLFLSGAIGAELPGVAIQLHVVSAYAHNVSGNDPVCPVNATVSGPGKAVSHEQAAVQSHWIDIHLPAPAEHNHWAALVTAVVAECHGGIDEEVVALRHGQRWIQSFEPFRVEAPRQELQELRQGGTYFIVGGLGGVGLAIAKHLSEVAKANLVLVTRAGLPERSSWDFWLKTRGDRDAKSQRMRAVMALEQNGSHVLIVAADASDLAAMQDAVALAKTRFGDINGAIHAAGVPGVGIIELKTREAASKVLRPKVQGTLILDRVLRDEPLDFLVICSSLIGFIGSSGQSDYGAANSFIDAFANSGRHQGRVAPVAIDYDRWDEIGMAVTAFAPMNIEQQGVEYEEIRHPVFAARFRQRDELHYVAHLSAADHWIVGEHLLRGQPAMVGTGYIELVRAAYQHASGAAPIEIRDVIFMGVMLVGPTEQREMHVILRPHDTESEFEVRSQHASGEWQTHAMGKVSGLAGTAPERHDLNVLLARCPKLHLAPQQAESSNTVAIQPLVDCSDRWNNIQSIAEGTEEAIAKLELPSAYATDLQLFPMHPALLDVATAFAIQFASKGASYLPFAYNHMRIRRPLTARMFSHVRFHPAETASDEFLSFDVLMLDERGEELARIDGYGMKRVKDVQAPAAELRGGHANKDATMKLPDALGSHLLSHEGVEVLRRVLTLRGMPQVEISTKGLAVYIETAKNQRNHVDEAQTEAYAPESLYPRPNLMTPFIAPRTAVEESIAQIWQAVMGLEQVGVHDNFIELGGHSLLAIQMTARVRELFEIDLSVATLYKNPTVEGLAQAVIDTLVPEVDGETLEAAMAELGQIKGRQMAESVEEAGP